MNTSGFQRLSVVITAIIVSLGLLCGCQGDSVASSGKDTESQTTAEYVYFVNEAKSEFLRRNIETGEDATVWEITGYPNRFNYMVTDSYILLIDDNSLYRVNPDGSGKYKYEGTYASSDLPSLPAIAVEDGTIYACASQQGELGGDVHLVEIQQDGSSIKEMGIDDISSTFCISGETLYALSEEAVIIVNLQTSEKSTVTLNAPVQALCADGADLITKDGKRLTFSEDGGIQESNAFSSDLGTPLGGVNGYIFFINESGTVASLNVLDLKSGETSEYDMNPETLFVSGNSAILYAIKDESDYTIHIFDTETGALS